MTWQSVQRRLARVAPRNPWRNTNSVAMTNPVSDEVGELLDCVETLALVPNLGTYAYLLQACGKLKALQEGKRVHAHILSHGLAGNLILGNHVVSMYGKCGSVQDARNAFEGMVDKNVVSWSAMISAYAQEGHFGDAFLLFRRMQLEGIKPNRVTFITVLNACMELAEGKFIHACVVESGFASNAVCGTAILSMYTKCGSLDDAQRMFYSIREQWDAVSWNAMISAYAQTGKNEDAVKLYMCMQLEGMKPTKVTLVAVLDVCASSELLAEGRSIHSYVTDTELELDTVVATALVDMYGKCGCLEDARKIFDGMHHRDVVSWNAMIAAYAQDGHLEEALEVFRKMPKEGCSKPNSVTFAAILDACASLSSLLQGKSIHELVTESGMEADIVAGTALVNMYAKCGSLEDGRKVFDAMQGRSIVTWSAMMGGYSQHGHGAEALKLFRQMHLEGIKPNIVALVTVLDACASLAALGESKLLHGIVSECGFEWEPVVGNALVDMFGKCGSLKNACRIFHRLLRPNVVAWTSLIAAFGQHGECRHALKLFHQMQQEGVRPSGITLINVLTGCSHAGLLEDGLCYFVSMKQDHGILWTYEHYGCLIDILARGGRLDEAEDLISRLPPNIVQWMTLLGACRSSKDVERGERVAEHVMKMDPHYDPLYVLLANIYAENGRWEDAKKVRTAAHLKDQSELTSFKLAISCIPRGT